MTVFQTARRAERMNPSVLREALQYAASEGHGPLRDWVAGELRSQGMAVDAAQVLITTGSQQGLDLVGKVLIDPGCTVAVESLPRAVERGMAFVPGAAFFAERPRANTLRLSFVTESAVRIDAGVALLAAALREQQELAP